MRIITLRRIAVPLLSFAAGCLGETAAILPTEPAGSAVRRVTITPSVAILAVGATQQLNVAAASLDGTPIATLDSVRYALALPVDTLRVRLTAGGMITALAPTSSPVRVNAIAYRNQTAAGETALLQVTATAIQGTTLSIQPVAPDSGKLSAGTMKTITPAIRNPGTGESVPNPVIRFTVRPGDARRMLVHETVIQLPGTGNRVCITCPSAQIFPTPEANQIRPLVGEGKVWIFAAVDAYGTLLQDSVEYTLSYPYALTVSSVKNNLAVESAGFANNTLTLAPGATVTFQNGAAAADPLTMTYMFDNPAAATAANPASTSGGASGNVTTLTGGQTSRRRFMTPGTYRWTMTATGGPAPWNGQTLAGAVVIK